MAVLLLMVVWPFAVTAAQNRSKGFYDKEALDRTVSQTTPDIRAILEDDIRGYLQLRNACSWPAFASSFRARILPFR